jgi:acyl carrier protein
MLEQKIISILTEARPEFNFKVEANSFIEKGMLDSFDIIYIVSEIEEKFKIVIDGDQILPENLDSIVAISALISRFSLQD